MNNPTLQRAMERTQADVFIGKNDAFLAPIMCQLKFSWRGDIPTARVSSKSMQWNPTWFMQLPAETRKTVLVHELWHIANLHHLRRGNRKIKIWNQAADVEINNMLAKNGYSFAGTDPWLMPELGDMLAEDIYDYFEKNNIKLPNGSWSGDETDEDLDTDISPAEEAELVQLVAYAHSVARQAGTKIDPAMAELLDKFMKPKVKWQNELHSILRPYAANKLTWAKRNRRFSHIMPSRKGKALKLKEITLFLDVSGSISTEQATRFITEVREIKAKYVPEILTIVQFDTDIQEVIVFKASEKFNKLQIVGRGGTDLQCVSSYIAEHKPDMAVVFSDMLCSPMEEPEKTKMVFIVQDNPSFSSFGFGSVIHVQD